MKDELRSPSWTTWWQTDLPAQFSPERARENAAFLTSLLGADWLRRRLRRPGATAHALVSEWLRGGVNAFFHLNQLAEDLRAVESAARLDTVLRDLRDAKYCRAAWQVIHVAALFGRGEGQTVVEFLQQDEQARPDFLLDLEGESVAVEVKRFFPSDAQERFSAYGRALCDLVIESVIPKEGIQPFVSLILKAPELRPDPRLVGDVVREVLGRFSGEPLVARTREFNVIAEPMQPVPVGLRNYRGCFVLSPRAEKENLRVQDRSKSASGQLQSLVDAGHTGLLCLGLNEYQEPHVVADLLLRRFKRGQYTSVSAVLLVRSGLHLAAPERCCVDLVAVVHNENAKVPLRGNPLLAPAGRLGSLTQAFPAGDEIAVYRVGDVLGQTDGRPDASLPMPSVHFLRRELLA